MRRIRVPRSAVLALPVLLVVLSGSALVGCSDDDNKTAAPADTAVAAKPPASASGTIDDYLKADSDLSTLATMVSGSALEQTLAGTEQITLFAPTNAAFAALPADTVEALKDPAQLTKVLNLHVVASKLDAAALIPLNGKTVDSLGGPVKVAIDGSTLKIGGAAVTRTDVFTSNGVIHILGAVITPKSA